MWETQVRFLGQEDPLKKELATHSSILAWRIKYYNIFSCQYSCTEIFPNMCSCIFGIEFQRWNLGHSKNSHVDLVNTAIVLRFSSVQLLSYVYLFATPWTAVHQAYLSIANSWSLLKFMSIESVSAIQLSHPLSSPSPSVFSLSQNQGLFQ